MKVLVTQSMLFPWVGLLEQISLADIIVHLDEVQFSKGGFCNRVQIKTASGIKWMTVPVKRDKLTSSIDSITIDNGVNWKQRHISLLKNSFSFCPFSGDALDLVSSLHNQSYSYISHLSRSSMLLLADYFGLLSNKVLVDSRDLCVTGVGSCRVLNIVKEVGGSTYITGHGARNYLDHNQFESCGINVEYMEYLSLPYPQKWGEFTPYVSGLDLVANLGKGGSHMIRPKTIPWKEFV